MQGREKETKKRQELEDATLLFADDLVLHSLFLFVLLAHSLESISENKPLRIFLQDGSNDLDNLHGSWPLANQEMAASLKFKKSYDYKFEFGDGGHNGKHGGAILPDALRWLWRERIEH